MASQVEGISEAFESSLGDHFEGPEKRLEIDYKKRTIPDDKGLRGLDAQFWTDVVASVNATILNIVSNDFFDAYVLSESSLFVYREKVIMLTCGTTKLLGCLDLLTTMSNEKGFEEEWVQYSRKNFKYPAAQPHIHSSFAEEVKVLKANYPEGTPYVNGPLDGDHWYVFMADYVERPGEIESDQLLNVYMHDIDPEVSEMFVKGKKFNTNEETTEGSGIQQLLPGSTIQSFLFDPCGYSMNGLNGKFYWTIHVTPEHHCSYASFESNVEVESYSKLVDHITSIFKPGRLQIITFMDEDSLYGARVAKRKEAAATRLQGYTANTVTLNEFQPGYRIQLANYVRKS